MTGMLTLEELKKEVLTGTIDTVSSAWSTCRAD
jgi:hypothetical protein